MGAFACATFPKEEVSLVCDHGDGGMYEKYVVIGSAEGKAYHYGIVESELSVVFVTNECGLALGKVGIGLKDAGQGACWRRYVYCIASFV